MYVILAGLSLLGCTKDVPISSDDLVQTVWRGVWNSYDDVGDKQMVSCECMFEFSSASQGRFNVLNSEGNWDVYYFDYSIDGFIINFKWPMMSEPPVRMYYITRCSGAKMVWESYNPRENITLKKIFPE